MRQREAYTELAVGGADNISASEADQPIDNAPDICIYWNIMALNSDETVVWVIEAAAAAAALLVLSTALFRRKKNKAADNVCDGCNANAVDGTKFRVERIPFLGKRVYCDKCHARMEEYLLSGLLLADFGLSVLGVIYLQIYPASAGAHVIVNMLLYMPVFVFSIVAHEFAHAIVGRWVGLKVPAIWIGRGNTFFRAKLLGFATEFKMIPDCGLTFFTHGSEDKLRIRYFLTILAGPAINAVTLAIAWHFVSWRYSAITKSVQFGTIIVLAQAVLLVVVLIPRQTRNAIGKGRSDGLNLLELLAVQSPQLLRARPDKSKTNIAGVPKT